jgi:sugar lactone lactonase YvrE
MMVRVFGPAAGCNRPGIKVDANGVVYVADAGDARVLKVTSDGKATTILQLESPWAPTDIAVFGDIVYVLEFSHTAGDDRTESMPRVRKITPDGKSTIIVTVDQMPGARPVKATAAAADSSFSGGVWHLFLRAVIFLI